MKYDDFGNRMKKYEAVSQSVLTTRTPVIMRLDGCAFHTFTKGLNRPFDSVLSDAMAATTEHLCSKIQGAVFGYMQSDEISILIQDWKNLNTDNWFGNNVQKMVSVSASIATAFFNKTYKHPSKDALALFDSRVFNIPKEEVANYFVWRQKDCTRNSINSLGQAHFSAKQLHGKNVSQVQDMLMETHNVNWNDIQTRYKRGTCVVNGVIDLECPIFTQDRGYIEKTYEFSESVVV
jgi:tRNA(His) 5'-end guanylyltransferase